MSDSILELKHDHHVIQQVAAGMSAIAELLDSGQRVDAEVLADLIEFLNVFGERCHHAKEEKYLFPVLETKLGGNRQLGALEDEHRTTAQLVNQLALVAVAYIQDPARQRAPLAAVLRRLAQLYPAHIWKEDYLLFPVAYQELSVTEKEHLSKKFEELEEEIGTDVHKAFEMLAKKLAVVVQYRSSGGCALCSPAA